MLALWEVMSHPIQEERIVLESQIQAVKHGEVILQLLARVTAHVVADRGSVCLCLSLCEMKQCGHFVSLISSQNATQPHPLEKMLYVTG